MVRILFCVFTPTISKVKRNQYFLMWVLLVSLWNKQLWKNNLKIRSKRKSLILLLFVNLFSILFFKKQKEVAQATFHEERMKYFEINLLKEIELFVIFYGLPSQVNTVNFGSLIVFIHEFYLLARWHIALLNLVVVGLIR